MREGEKWNCEVGMRKVEKQKLRRWEDGKVGRAQSAWGIGHRAEVGMRKVGKKEVGTMGR